MLHDCGILTPGPKQDWIRRAYSFDSMRPEDRHDVSVLLMTPGFPATYLAHVLGKSVQWVHYTRKKIDEEAYRDLALANWNSITRDDALALNALRPKGKQMPVICLVYMMQDLNQTGKWAETARTWNVAKGLLTFVVKNGPFAYGHRKLPDWFRQLVLT